MYFQPKLAGTPLTSDELAEAVEEEPIVVRKGPSTPKPWISLGSETEVMDESVVENRAKVYMQSFI